MWRKGFSLLELLVVIAIIATLAAILFPVFSIVREQARKSACQGNFRQLGTAMFLYAQDYDDTFPLAAWRTSSTTAGGRWYNALEPYTKVGAAPLRCPSNPTTVANGALHSHLGLSLNAVLDRIQLNPPSIPWSVTVRPLDDYGQPAGTVLLAEAGSIGMLPVEALNTPSAWLQYMCAPTDWDVTTPSCFNKGEKNCTGYVPVSLQGEPAYPCGKDGNASRIRYPVPVHGNFVNVLFADGHTKAVHIQELTGVSSPNRPNGWIIGDEKNLWDNQ